MIDEAENVDGDIDYIAYFNRFLLGKVLKDTSLFLLPIYIATSLIQYFFAHAQSTHNTHFS